MRLPTNVRTGILARFCVIGLTAALAGCGANSIGNLPSLAATSAGTQSNMAGPSADYPIVVGEPYEIDGKLYTPLDTMNYDEVGYAAADALGGAGVTASHRTLPLPSYVEITSLETGTTILARVERRGPMTGNGVVALSGGAQAQLAIAGGAAVRIRRVNPVEVDRVKLRLGETAPLRMETPKSLLTVLKRKLSGNGPVNLASAAQENPGKLANPAKVPDISPAPTPASASAETAAITELTPIKSPNAPAAAPIVAANTGSKAHSSGDAPTPEDDTVAAYPLDPVGESGAVATTQPVAPLVGTTDQDQATPAQQASNTAPVAGQFLVQAAAFSIKSNAENAANSIDGFVQRSGKYYRVRMGPFVSRGQADAALAKARAAGYKDARVFTAG